MACIKGGGNLCSAQSNKPTTIGALAQGSGVATVQTATDSSADAETVQPVMAYPDDVDISNPYPLHSWAFRMHMMRILSEMGFHSLSYPDGKNMVQDVLDSLGWVPITNYRDLQAYQPVFFWCNDYTAKEVIEYRAGNRLRGLQFVSSLPNVICLHNKKLLQKLVRQYESAVLNATKGESIHLCNIADIRKYNSDSYLPRTLFDVTPEELKYIADACFTRRSIWIAKPLSQNCGRGISLIRTRAQLLDLEERLSNVIIQEYIRNPVTLDGRKSDMRVYLLLVCPERGHLMAFYHPGFVRLSLRPYTEDAEDLAVHLTNQSVAKATEEWSERRDESTWTPAEMNFHLNTRPGEHEAFPTDFVFKQLHPKMKAILGIVSRAAFPEVTRVGGCFEFLGCDFMLDTNGRVWLIELNCYPGMAVSTRLLKVMKPQVVNEAICLAMECISKQFQGKPMYPLESLRQFQLLWNSEE